MRHLLPPAAIEAAAATHRADGTAKGEFSGLAEMKAWDAR